MSGFLHSNGNNFPHFFALVKLKINNARVLHVHYPDSQVVALLVHTDYIADVTAAFAVAKIEPLTNFDPLDPASFVTPSRLVRALKYIRETVRPAVGRSLFKKDWITLDQYIEAVPRATRAPTNKNAAEDATMDEVIDTFSPSLPAALPPAQDPLDDVPMPPMDTQPTMPNMLNITIWNANGCNRYTVDQTTNALLSSSLLFITETWLLSPLRLMTSWQQYHTYGQQLEGQSRGQMGVSLLVNPDCPYPVTHFPSSSPYVLSCQVSSLLVHCVYLPPSLSDLEAMDILDALPHQTHASQTNTIVCGDFNARHQHLLGDSRTTTRGIRLFSWILENGMTCWNSQLSYGIPTFCSQGRVNATTGERFNSVIDLFLSSQQLVNPTMLVHEDLSLGSDHHPVSLSCVLPPPPPPPPAHPRLLWNLSRLAEPDCLYVDLFRSRIQPFRECLTTSPRRFFCTR
ncbi:hypothetical protein G6F56_010350 [Rhizopus delemar]|nr:hypothetical protein G6F56_010350 [Rhizopus delemar]